MEVPSKWLDQRSGITDGSMGQGLQGVKVIGTIGASTFNSFYF